MNKLPVLALLVVATACCDAIPIFRGNPDNIGVSSTDYTESTAPIVGHGIDELWEHAQEVLRMQGYDVDATRTRFPERSMVTHWMTRLAPNRFEGYRTRIWVRFVEVSPGHWSVGAAAQRQRNADIDHPAEISNAKWEEQPVVDSRSELVVHQIESAYRDAEADSADAKDK